MTTHELPQPIDWPAFWATNHKAEEWLCEPVLPRGKAISVYSPAKVGKSLLLLDIAARLATGQRVLDQPAGAPIHVVYIDMEMTEDDLKERLEDMDYGSDTDWSHLRYYLLPDLPALDTLEGGEALLEIVRRDEAALVVIDTTSDVLSGRENDADTLRAYWYYTGLPLKSAGVTVARLDHAGKDLSKGMRGTSAKAADVDLVWQLTSREAGSVLLKATHRRQSWIPESVPLVRLENPLRHEHATESWPAGAQALAALLDEWDVPSSLGERKVREILKQREHKGARGEVLRAAIRLRREHPKGASETPGRAPGRAPGRTP